MKRVLALLLVLMMLLPAAAALAEPTLRRGMNGTDVETAQAWLQYYGYEAGAF